MRDESYSPSSLKKLISKSEIRSIPAIDREKKIEELAENASSLSKSAFNGMSPIVTIKVKGKTAYKIKDQQSAIVLKKWISISKNNLKSAPPSRHRITNSIQLLLEEGVPFRIYRLDISKFFESISESSVAHSCEHLSSKNPIGRNLITAFFKHFKEMGGTGVPRGIALSSVISEHVLHPFDTAMKNQNDVFHYERFVDDIVIITSADENKQQFLALVKSSLPIGLTLNKSKTRIYEVPNQIPKQKNLASTRQELFRFNFLGYSYIILNPSKTESETLIGKRIVSIGIAPSKIKRFKTRISRCFIDFHKNGDTTLLLDRIKYLSSNYYVFNKSSHTRRLAGISFGYPLVNDFTAIDELDKFLKMLILNQSSRLSRVGPHKLTKQQMRPLLRTTFKMGFTNRRFVYFTTQRMHEIQECWANESIPQK